MFSKLMRKRPLAMTLAIATTAAIPAVSSAANFADVSVQAGVDVSSRGGSWGDFNGDGCQDLILAKTGGVTLLSNINDPSFGCMGLFHDVTDQSGITGPSSAWSAVWADYDGDNDLDVYVTSMSEDETNALWRNDGNSFSDVTVAEGLDNIRGNAGASWGDYDGDGDLDIFVAGRFGADAVDQLFRNDGGSFTEVAVAAGIAGEANRLTFMGMFFDYDNDGDQDLYLSVDFNSDVLYQNNGDATFTDVSAAAGIGQPEHGMGLSLGDFNNDGCMDIISSNNTGTGTEDPDDDDHKASVLYLNNCDGTFSGTNEEIGILDQNIVEWGLNLIDYDNDGDLDLSVVAGGMLSDGEPNTFYENNGNGELFVITEEAGVANSGAAFGSIWADVDNDGDLDWYVNNASEDIPGALFRNDSARGNYFKVDLQGAGMNTDAVGAIVKVTAGSRTQMRIISAGTSYVGGEPLIAHFGLGVKDKVDSVEVIWPNNGGVTELFDLAANQTILVEQTESEPVLGTVSGLVIYQSLPVISAAVNLRDPATSQVLLNVNTDENGFFDFGPIVPRDYRIDAFIPSLVPSRAIFFDLEEGGAEDLVLELRPPRPSN